MDGPLSENSDLRIRVFQNVRTEDVRRVMNQYVWDTCPVAASKGPVEALPHYANMRAKMYKVFY